jgi:hypothetical protein
MVDYNRLPEVEIATLSPKQLSVALTLWSAKAEEHGTQLGKFERVSASARETGTDAPAGTYEGMNLYRTLHTLAQRQVTRLREEIARR